MTTYDYELTLIKRTFVDDGLGGQIPGDEIRTTLLCQKKSVTRNEFYTAKANGLQPEVVFVIHGYEYGDQKEVKFEGETYNVIRTYSTDFEEIELICQKEVPADAN